MDATIFHVILLILSINIVSASINLFNLDEFAYFHPENIKYHEKRNINETTVKQLENIICNLEGLNASDYENLPPNCINLLTSTTQSTPLSSTIYINLDDHNDVICDDDETAGDANCIIDHTVVCVGEREYCNHTYDEYREMILEYIYPSTGEWILIASHTVVFLMGLVGNALVCMAVYTNHSMRTVTNIFIVNLAVADFFVILLCLPPTVVWDVTESWFMGRTMCKVVLYFQTVAVTVSVLTLTFISIDRWYAIVFPLRYKPRPERAWRAIAVIWMIAFGSDIPELLTLTTRRKKLRFDMKLFTQCEPTWDIQSETTFCIVKFVFLYTLPLLFMTIAYTQIVRVLWRSDTIPGHRESRLQAKRGGTTVVGNSSTMGQLRARRKAAKMLVAVVVMFACCYFPVHMLSIARFTFDIAQTDVVAVLSLVSHWLCYANSAINPVIYNFMSGKFRREFKNAIEKCKCLRGQHGLGGRVGYDERSMYHTTTRVNSNTQQTSFTSVQHTTNHRVLQNRNSNNYQTQISPISMEERMALTKSVDGETAVTTLGGDGRRESTGNGAPNSHNMVVLSKPINGKSNGT